MASRAPSGLSLRGEPVRAGWVPGPCGLRRRARRCSDGACRPAPRGLRASPPSPSAPRRPTLVVGGHAAALARRLICSTGDQRPADRPAPSRWWTRAALPAARRRCRPRASVTAVSAGTVRVKALAPPARRCLPRSSPSRVPPALAERPARHRGRRGHRRPLAGVEVLGCDAPPAVGPLPCPRPGDDGRAGHGPLPRLHRRHRQLLRRLVRAARGWLPPLSTASPWSPRPRSDVLLPLGDNPVHGAAGFNAGIQLQRGPLHRRSCRWASPCSPRETPRPWTCTNAPRRDVPRPVARPSPSASPLRAASWPTRTSGWPGTWSSNRARRTGTGRAPHRGGLRRQAAPLPGHEPPLHGPARLRRVPWTTRSRPSPRSPTCPTCRTRRISMGMALLGHHALPGQRGPPGLQPLHRPHPPPPPRAAAPHRGGAPPPALRLRHRRGRSAVELSAEAGLMPHGARLAHGRSGPGRMGPGPSSRCCCAVVPPTAARRRVHPECWAFAASATSGASVSGRIVRGSTAPHPRRRAAFLPVPTAAYTPPRAAPSRPRRRAGRPGSGGRGARAGDAHRSPGAARGVPRAGRGRRRPSASRLARRGERGSRRTGRGRTWRSRRCVSPRRLSTPRGSWTPPG